MAIPHKKAEKALDALGNPVRRRIVHILSKGPRAVGEIAAELPVSRPAVSKHLRLLERARVVRHERHGTQNVFELDQAGFDAARHWLEGFWDDALSRFVLLAENTEERRP